MSEPINETDEYGLPKITATSFYDTRGAAAILGCTQGQLRQWRFRKCGPKYQKPSGGIVQYLGLWLIEFRKASIVEPTT